MEIVYSKCLFERAGYKPIQNVFSIIKSVLLRFLWILKFIFFIYGCLIKFPENNNLVPIFLSFKYLMKSFLLWWLFFFNERFIFFNVGGSFFYQKPSKFSNSIAFSVFYVVYIICIYSLYFSILFKLFLFSFNFYVS
jgi:hypothetical protein